MPFPPNTRYGLSSGPRPLGRTPTTTQPAPAQPSRRPGSRTFPSARAGPRSRSGPTPTLPPPSPRRGPCRAAPRGVGAPPSRDPRPPAPRQVPPGCARSRPARAPDRIRGGVNPTRRTPTEPRRPSSLSGPAEPGPAAYLAGGGVGAQARAPAGQSPRPFPGPPTALPALGTAPDRAGGKGSSFSLNPKSRAGASSRDLRGRLQITHNTPSFLSTPAFQDGEFGFCSWCWLCCLSSIRCHPPRSATARGSLQCPERGAPRRTSLIGLGAG